MLGKPVPDFSLPGTGGNFRLKDERGKKLVLYFYPKDNTPGCTQQGSDFRDHFKSFEKASCAIYGISRDSLRSYAGFKAKMRFPFELLSDEDRLLHVTFTLRAAATRIRVISARDMSRKERARYAQAN